MSILKKCKACSILFEPIKSIQPYCFNCTIERAKKHVKKQRDKKERDEKKELKEKLKTVSDYRTEARYWFQRWIRMRDVGKSCISCNTFLNEITKFDAGHYYNAKSYPTLVFDEYNCSGQCVFCNQHKSGNLIEYRKGIIKRYGQKVLDYLDEKSEDKSVRTLSKEHYIEIAKKYKELCKK